MVASYLLSLREGLEALLGYNGNPSLTEVAAYLLYFVFLWIGSFFIRKPSKYQKAG
jgi:high-affinity Fe2+/Pb2+ permease